jgi:hypothetical protein
MTNEPAVQAIAVTCGKCGAGLELPPDARFVTCTYCGSRLELHRTGGAAYTQVLDSIQQHTERIAGDVERIRRENELERLDREWMMQREQHMVSGKNGSRHVPGRAGSLAGAALAGVFGIFWTGLTISLGAPGFFPLFGLLFIAVAIIGGISAFTKAGDYEEAERAYQRRRAELFRQMQNSRGNNDG